MDEKKLQIFAEALLQEMTNAIGTLTETSITAAKIIDAIKTNDNSSLAVTAEYADGGNISPSLQIRPMYDAYMDGESITDLAKKAIGTLEAAHVQPDVFNLARINADAAKDALYLAVINRDLNSDIAQKCAHIDIQGTDLMAVPRFRVENFQDGQASILVTRNVQASILKMTDDELLQMARANTISDSFTVRGMSEVMRDMMGMPDEMLAEMQPMLDGPEQMYVASNISNLGGATVLLSKDTLAAAHEKIGGDFFVIPSSVHEVLFVPAATVSDPKDLQMMCREVNATQVALNDQLGENIFYCDGRSLSICNSIEELQEIQDRLTKGFEQEIADTISRGVRI